MSQVSHGYTLLKEEIRLVNLQPAAQPNAPETSSVDDKIRCSIDRYPLGNAPPYFALSYHWGSSTLRAGVLIDGRETSITHNLEAALRHLRPEPGSEPLRIWIDDLCIDQHNNTEKSEQVSHMRDIYQKATGVTSWLGAAADRSDLAMSWIETFGHRSWELGIGTKPELQLMRLLKHSEKEIAPELRQFLSDIRAELSPGSRRYTELGPALTSLFQRPYWGRIWVVQEVAVGSSVTFMCGQGKVSEECLHHALRLFRNFTYHQHIGQRVQRDGHVESKASQTMRAVDPSRPINLLKIRRAPGPLPLIYLLRSLRHFQASDPRDKVIALLGIASDREALGLVSDYNKTCEEVYIDAAYALMKNGWMEVLSLSSSAHKIPSLPSWVPDWMQLSETTYLQQRALLRASRPLRSVLQPSFSASKRLTEAAAFDADSLSFLGGPISLPALSIDVVERLSIPRSENGVTHWLQDLWALASLSASGEPLAAWRCSVADQEIRQANEKPRLSKQLLTKIIDVVTSLDVSSINARELIEAGLGDYAIQLQAIAKNRRPFLTTAGLLGVGPKEMKERDQIVIIPGADVPYVIRRQEGVGYYRMIGEVYVHGIMDGEATARNPRLGKIVLT